jgi:ABC-type branched-subunit amino acid transport system substrate-binding protein
VEQTRRLVEQQQVAFIFGSVGTAQNAAIRSYLNDNKIPQVFIASGFSMFADPRHYPWTIAFNPSNRTEGYVFAKHVLSSKPDAKIAVLYQNDDLGKDYLNGVKDGLGASHAAALVKEASYEVSEPTVDSQVITLQGSGADTLIIGANPKAASQALRNAYDLGWAPERYLGSTGSSITSVLQPAGIDKSKGVITNYWRKGTPRTPAGPTPPTTRNGLRLSTVHESGGPYRRLCGAWFRFRRSHDLCAQAVRRRSVARRHHAPSDQSQRLCRTNGSSGREGKYVAH